MLPEKSEFSYTLGADKDEQKRLFDQQTLYGDAQFLKFGANDSVCELGCGAGANLWIAQNVRKFTGVDIQPAQIAECRHRAEQLGLTNTEFFLADSCNLPFKNNLFDATFCRLVLIHLPDPMATIQEMFRITRSSGKIIAIEAAVSDYFTTKPFLMKCFKKRIEYTYQPERGSLEIAKNLPTLFQLSGLKKIKTTKHEILATGKEKDRLTQLFINWIGMIKPISSALLEKNYLTENDLMQAEKEITEISAEDYIYQVLWVTEGQKI